MPNPAPDLFNDATLAAKWTAIRCTSALEEGPSGSGCLVVDRPLGDWGSTYSKLGGVRAELPAGDFDYAVVGEPMPVNLGELVYLALGIGSADQATMDTVSTYPGYARGQRHDGTAWGWSYLFGPAVGEYRRPVFLAARLKRVGTTLSCYAGAWADGAVSWTLLGSIADQLAGGAGFVHVGGHSSGLLKFRLRAFLNVGAAPAAPTGGLAFSAPATGDVDLGVAFCWDAAPADVARTVEVQTATDAGFTTGLQVRVLDRIQDGDKASHRRAGVGVGVVVYGRARYVDELGQAGTWSATVSAAAAVNPTASPTYASPVVAVRAGEAVRIVRSPA